MTAIAARATVPVRVLHGVAPSQLAGRVVLHRVVRRWVRRACYVAGERLPYGRFEVPTVGRRSKLAVQQLLTPALSADVGQREPCFKPLVARRRQSCIVYHAHYESPLTW
jgi:hypothetical protein